MKNKRIGIMSMQRIVNYGSYLQAYALKGMIESMNTNAIKFIDYEYEEPVMRVGKVGLTKKILANDGNILHVLRKKMHYNRFNHMIDASLSRMGVLGANYSKDIDTLVIGSDEVFNCMQGYPVGYSRGLFGKGYEKSNVISYAASFGYTRYDDLVEKGISDEIAIMLSKFRSISVRDENSEAIVKRLLPDRKVYRHLDPVLVGDFGNVGDRSVDYDNYIIVYAYSGRLSKREERAIRKFARSHHKKIISLGFYQRCADYNLIVDPLDVLAYFKNADFVITDTFHGSVFSIKMNTKFCTIVRDSNKNKLTSLLKSLHCESQMVNSVDDIENVYHSDKDFAETNIIIEKETKRSKDYLEGNI